MATFTIIFLFISLYTSMHLTVYRRIKALETVLEKVKNELIETNSDCLYLNRFLLYAPTQTASQEVFKGRSRFQICGDRKTCKYCVTLSSPDLCFDVVSPPPHPTPTHPHITESPHAAHGCMSSQASLFTATQDFMLEFLITCSTVPLSNVP